MVNCGFPPIKYKNNDKKESTTKERHISNVSKTNLNIRQILLTDVNKKNIIDLNDKMKDDLEVVDNI